jgi:hypothetical protein
MVTSIGSSNTPPSTLKIRDAPLPLTVSGAKTIVSAPRPASQSPSVPSLSVLALSMASRKSRQAPTRRAGAR